MEGNKVTSPWRRNKTKDLHPLHSLCSYLGAFPPSLPRFFINRFSKPDQWVLDPFSGRGTTLLEARLLGRNAIACDLNPIAIALSQAKAASFATEDILSRIDNLESRFDFALYMPEAMAQPEEVHLIFHPRTLAQLCFLKRKLLDSKNPADQFILGCLLGVLHGGERSDGSSQYASINMPNTFSMSPEYVRRYVQSKRLNREFRDVFALLRTKTNRVQRQSDQLKGIGKVFQTNAKNINVESGLEIYAGKIDLVVTSPPYLGVVNYAKQNWIRSWLLNADPIVVSQALDDNLNLDDWLGFMKSVSISLKDMLSKSGVAVFVIGDVAKSKTSIIPLAREFRMMIEENKIFKHSIMIADHFGIEDKTTKIWGETKGEATAIDRIVILSDFDVRDRLLDIDSVERIALEEMITEY